MPARRTIARYTLHDEIASGGMATVHLARLRGEGDFSRIVAIKVMHAQYAKEEVFRAMFLDEARLVSRIRHPNVVATLDVLQDEGDLFLVMDYVHGEALSRLLKVSNESGARMPIGVATSIVKGVLEGLHAAHEAKSEDGAPLEVVHRDVSPHNILVGTDGIARVADFGVAKAAGRLAEKFSADHVVKGKAGYMSPEQMRGTVDRRADIYAAGVVLWECLTGQRLFSGESFLAIATRVMDGDIAKPSSVHEGISKELDAVVMKAVMAKREERYETAREMALALERAEKGASGDEIGAWVESVAHGALERRRSQMAAVERDEATEREEQTRTFVPPTIVDPPMSSPSIATISGIAPSRTEPPARKSQLPTIAIAVIAAAGISVLAYVEGSRRALVKDPRALDQVAVASSASAPPSAASSPLVASDDPSSIVTMASATPSAVTDRSRVHPPRGGAAPRGAAPSGSTTRSCHWEEIPDSQGIMIPKKVCP